MKRIKSLKFTLCFTVIILLLTGVFGIHAPIAEGVPAMPGIRVHTQSDGGVVSYQLIGDEFLNYMIDDNGDLLAFGDDEDLYYAEWVNESLFLKSASPFSVTPTEKKVEFVVRTNKKPTGRQNDILLNESDMRPLKKSIPKFILDEAGKRMKERDASFREWRGGSQFMPMNQGVAMATSEIERNLLVIYVRFEDESNIPELQNKEISNARIHNTVFNDALQGSAAHYYRTVTNEVVKLVPARETQGAVNDGIIRVTVPGSHKDWRNSVQPFVTDVVTPALREASSYINFRDYTSSNYLTGRNLSIVFIIHGYESSASYTLAPGVWGHAATGGNFGSSNGVMINAYCAFGAFHSKSEDPQPFTAGIVVHELGHNSFGFYDFYDIGNNRTRGITGAWSVMGQGSWGAVQGEPGGSTPTGLDAYHLSTLYPPTFTVPAANLEAGQQFSLTGVSQFIKLETAFPNQYFLLQPRGSVGYDRGTARTQGLWLPPYSGLMIYHIDENKAPSVSDVNPIWQEHPFIDIEEAHGGDQHLQNATQYHSGNAEDLFFGIRNKFDISTDPNSNLYDSNAAITQNVASGVTVSDIVPTVTGQNTPEGTVTVTFNVGINSPPVIVSPSLPTGTVGTDYNQTLAATGTAPITWAIASGSLPTGLSLNATTGQISGTPTAAGTSSFNVRATNSVGNDTKPFSIVINAALVPPAITTASLPTGTVGTDYNQTLAATGTTPITWAITSGSLPTGLSLNTTTGQISGTPTAAGTFSFNVRATNNAGNDTKPFSIVISAALVPLAITTPSLSAGTVGMDYNQTLAATGTTPITWAIASGSLPTGLSLNATSGIISGRPTMWGTYNFTIRASNSEGNDSKAFSIVVGEALKAPIIQTTSLSGGVVDTPYNETLKVSGSIPIIWSINSGSLPSGLSLNATTGLISGRPTTVGTFSFSVRATNDAGYATRSLKIVITTPPTINTASLPGGIVGKNYSQRLTVSGTTPITWSVDSGNLPSGLSLNTTGGNVTGTPTSAGTFNFTIRATNVAGYVTKNLSIVITALPIITTVSLPGGTLGNAYNQTLAATGTTPITWSISSGRLPAGLVLNETTGLISGTSTALGTSSFTVRATNVAGYASKSLSIAITALPVITTISLPDSIVGKAYNQRLVATGTTPITWSIASGNLPSGLSLNATSGAITGAPTEAGSYSFSVMATNVVGNATKALSIVVTAPPVISTASLPGSTLGAAYNQRLEASGTTPITWTITSGKLPAGLSLNATTGVITGTSTALGTSNFTVRATNVAGYASKSLSIAITVLSTITNDSLPGGIVGKNYNQRLVATGTTPITWSIASGNLPSGLSLNATSGAITGAPTAAGSYSFSVRATNIVGDATKTLNIIVTAIPAITTPSLPGGALGSVYNQTLAATGTTPITWTITSGKLPAGLSLNATTGVITGTSTALGTSSFTVRATNVAGYASKSLSIAITALPTITNDSLPGGIVGKNYNQRLIATGTTPITWSIASGNLPPGLSVNATSGAITGAPTAAGSYSFSVRATNVVGDATKALNIIVTAIPAITTPSLPGGVVGTSYTQTLVASGTTPITWSITSGKLPAGLVLNETTGVISGAPTTMGTFNFAIRATNVAGYAAKTLSIVITAPPTITTVSLPGGIVGRNYSQRLTASGTTPITWAIASGNPPPGLSLNAATGYISGAPTTVGTFNFTIRATNTAGETTKPFSIVVS